MKEYIVFWTYAANYAANPRRVKALGPMRAIEQTWPQYAADKLTAGGMGCEDREVTNDIRFLVFEVGGDLVHDGVFQENRLEN